MIIDCAEGGTYGKHCGGLENMDGWMDRERRTIDEGSRDRKLIAGTGIARRAMLGTTIQSSLGAWWGKRKLLLLYDMYRASLAQYHHQPVSSCGPVLGA